MKIFFVEALIHFPPEPPRKRKRSRLVRWFHPTKELALETFKQLKPKASLITLNQLSMSNSSECVCGLLNQLGMDIPSIPGKRLIIYPPPPPPPDYR